MATGTSASDGTVIDMRRFPGRRRVAVIADAGAGNMGGGLAGGGRAVVATGTNTGNKAMVEMCR